MNKLSVNNNKMIIINRKQKPTTFLKNSHRATQTLIIKQKQQANNTP